MARKRHTIDFKGIVALEAIKNEMTIAEICTKYEVAPTQVKDWKNEALRNMGLIFVRSKQLEKESYRCEEEYGRLERKIGQLTIENDYLKKNLTRYHRKNES